MLRTGLSLITVLAAALVAGCTVQETDAPPLAGPSGFALSINLQAVPDSIYQDGASQSSIDIVALDANSQPVRALTLRVGMMVNGVVADIGTLSSRTVVTDDEGRAHVTYTAPQQPIESVGGGQMVTLIVLPVGTDSRAAQETTVDIRLIPPGVILPPAGELVPAFNLSPTEVLTFQAVSFDASATTQGGVVCGPSCTYVWSFGDGGSGSGQITSHQFRAPGSYVVTLRVIGSRSQQKSTTQTVTVGAGTAPTAAFVYSPPDPNISQDIFFNAAESTAPAPRRIVSYAWDFGSGRQGSGVTVTKRYDSPGTYNVTLTVTDDANQRATATETVTVGTGGTGLNARVIFSPTSPRIGEQIVFDARESSGPLPIVRYQFDIGESGGAGYTSTDGLARHTFGAAGTYVVRVTVTDTSGRTATTTANVTVGSQPPEAAFVFSPGNPTVGQTINFSAATSTAAPGRSIASYSWSFGDGTSGTGVTRQKSYTAAGTYVVSLTVTDSAGEQATVTQSVTVTP